ncbi:MAG TPA: Rrf2 family transcriptional regulator [Kiloniellales bacterium]
MKMSAKGRYAVMALADLAVQARPGPVTLYDIAERQDISLSYLEQLFAKLRRSDLVKSVRGPGGGYLLARDPSEMPISDIVLAVDEPAAGSRCTPSQPMSCRDSEARCLTHDLWEELGNQMYRYLRSVTLEDVIKQRVLAASSALPVDTAANPPPR